MNDTKININIVKRDIKSIFYGQDDTKRVVYG